MLQVDVTKPDQVVAAVKTAKVVINTVGPFWTYGTPVVRCVILFSLFLLLTSSRACVQNGVHYVDLTGEHFWVKDIIQECASLLPFLFSKLSFADSTISPPNRLDYRANMRDGLYTQRPLRLPRFQDASEPRRQLDHRLAL